MNLSIAIAVALISSLLAFIAAISVTQRRYKTLQTKTTDYLQRIEYINDQMITNLKREHRKQMESLKSEMKEHSKYYQDKVRTEELLDTLEDEIASNTETDAFTKRIDKALDLYLRKK